MFLALTNHLMSFSSSVSEMQLRCKSYRGGPKTPSQQLTLQPNTDTGLRAASQALIQDLQFHLHAMMQAQPWGLTYTFLRLQNMAI